MRVRSLRRFVENRGVVTIGLTLLASALLAVAAWTILERTTFDDDGPVTGVIPAEMPDGFPIPAGAVIGESTVDPDRNLTTVDLTTYGSLVDAVSTHTIGLVSNGYVVEESIAQGDGWEIRFSRLDMRGTIELRPGADGISSSITILDP